MNPAHAGVAALLAIAAISPVVSRSPAPDPFTTASIDLSGSMRDRFELRSSGWDVGCAVAAGEQLSETMRVLTVDPSCVALDPGLAGASWWLERPDGSIAFTRRDGEVLAEFSPGDGAAYESYYPRRPILTLLADD